MAAVNDRMFGPYRLHGLIARGGMGEVHRAYDTRQLRFVALKLLLESLSVDPVYRARFAREAQVAAQLRDPHVIPIHGFGEIDNRLYLDMRLVEGDNLRAVISRDIALAPSRIVGIVEQVAAALDAAHDEGLIHRDVKPANILLTAPRNGRPEFVYLADFGIARSTDPDTQTGLTATDALVGTTAYMAPERFLGGAIDRRVDIYALACVLYQGLTGRKPFPGDELVAQMQGHVMQPPPVPSEHRDGLPSGFDAVIARGLAKDPADRYPTAGDLAAAARAVLDAPARPEPEPDLATEVQPAIPVAARWEPAPDAPRQDTESGPRPRRRRFRIIAAAVAVVLTLAAGTVVIGRTSQRYLSPILATEGNVVLVSWNDQHRLNFGNDNFVATVSALNGISARKPTSVGRILSDLVANPVTDDMYAVTSEGLVVADAMHGDGPATVVPGTAVPNTNQTRRVLAVTRDGKLLFFSRPGMRRIDILDTTTMRSTGRALPVDSRGMVMSPDGSRLYVATPTGIVVLAPTLEGETIAPPIPVTDVFDLTISRDGSRIALLTRRDQTLIMIDTRTGAITRSLENLDDAFGVAISPDGSRAYVARPFTGVIEVIDTGTGNTVGAPIRLPDAAQHPVGLAINGDGSRLVVAVATEGSDSLGIGNFDTVGPVQSTSIMQFDTRTQALAGAAIPIGR